MEEDEVYKAILNRIDEIGRKIDEFPSLIDGIGRKMDENHELFLNMLDKHAEMHESMSYAIRGYAPFGRFPEVMKYMGRVRIDGNRLVPISYREAVENP